MAKGTNTNAGHTKSMTARPDFRIPTHDTNAESATSV